MVGLGCDGLGCASFCQCVTAAFEEFQVTEGGIPYYSLKTTPADHNGTDVGVNIRRFDSNPSSSSVVTMVIAITKHDKAA